MRKWKLEIFLLNTKDQEVDACSIFESFIYHLHPTFENSIRTVTESPYMIEEQGWGEFDLVIVGNFIENGGKVYITHDLTFDKNAYVADFSIKVPYHISKLREGLLSNGPVPLHEESGIGRKSFGNENKLILKISKANDNIIKDIIQRIIINDKVNRELRKCYQGNEFVICLGQLPDEVIEEIYQLVLKSERVE